MAKRRLEHSCLTTPEQTGCSNRGFLFSDVGCVLTAYLVAQSGLEPETLAYEAGVMPFHHRAQYQIPYFFKYDFVTGGISFPRATYKIPALYAIIKFSTVTGFL